MAKHDVAVILDTVLSTPGMSEPVKLTLKISRKNLLLLGKIVERGLSPKTSEERFDLVLEAMTADTKKEIGDVTMELLEKAGLTAVHEKLNMLYVTSS